MIKKLIALILSMTMITSFTSCSSKYEKYSNLFFDTFDTVIQITAFTKSQEEFDKYFDYAKNRFSELSKLYDKFYPYENINNIYTINKNAGIEPVKVEDEVIDLIKFAKEQYDNTNGIVNIAMGKVLSLWQNFISNAKNDENYPLPTEEELNKANEYSDINAIIIDEKNKTVFIDNKDTQIDVGAVAKGFATQIVKNELTEMGLKSFFINAGGNTTVGDKPLDGIHNKWSIGIQNPDTETDFDGNSLIDAIVTTNDSIVTSGDYQRYVMYKGRRIHHIINGNTLQPADLYRGVTVVTKDSGLADIYSTALFCMNYETGKAFAQKNDIKVLWIFADGKIETTDDLLPMLMIKGNAGNKI